MSVHTYTNHVSTLIVSDFTSLARFQHLEEVELFAGKFYSDKIDELLHMRGQKITKLTFMSIREIEFKALAIIAVCCPNLKELTFSNCDFDFITGRGGEDLNTRSDDVKHKK